MNLDTATDFKKRGVRVNHQSWISNVNPSAKIGSEKTGSKVNLGSKVVFEKNQDESRNKANTN